MYPDGGIETPKRKAKKANTDPVPPIAAVVSLQLLQVFTEKLRQNQCSYCTSPFVCHVPGLAGCVASMALKCAKGHEEIFYFSEKVGHKQFVLNKQLALSVSVNGFQRETFRQVLEVAGIAVESEKSLKEPIPYLKGIVDKLWDAEEARVKASVPSRGVPAVFEVDEQHKRNVRSYGTAPACTCTAIDSATGKIGVLRNANAAVAKKMGWKSEAKASQLLAIAALSEYEKGCLGTVVHDPDASGSKSVKGHTHPKIPSLQRCAGQLPLL